MNGWIDVVRVEDGEVVLSKELKHVVGNVTILKKTDRPNEVMLATQKGVYFAHIGTALGLMEVEMQRFDKTLNRLESPDGKPLLAAPEGSELADHTSAGAKHTDLEGMSQMTFHT